MAEVRDQGSEDTGRADDPPFRVRRRVMMGLFGFMGLSLAAAQAWQGIEMVKLLLYPYTLLTAALLYGYGIARHFWLKHGLPWRG